MEDVPSVPVIVQQDCAGPYDAWLLPRLQMQFPTTDGPVRAARPKLGGQPVWLDRPTWPLSRSSGEPMVFVGQFPVPEGRSTRLAYLFLTDDVGCTAPTCEPEAGENALLVQPDGRVPSFVRTCGAVTGPSLWRRGVTWDDHVDVELAVELVPLDAAVEAVLDADIAVGEAERAGVLPDRSQGSEVAAAAPGPYSYLGGKVRRWQAHLPLEVPDDWRFHFQLDHGDGNSPGDPYALNLGGGSGYGFLSPDLREGRFSWDCV